jgi:hypothetical protein
MKKGKSSRADVLRPEYKRSDFPKGFVGRPPDGFIGGSNVHILHIVFSAQLALGEDVVHMLGHDGALAAK